MFIEKQQLSEKASNYQKAEMGALTFALKTIDGRQLELEATRTYRVSKKRLAAIDRVKRLHQQAKGGACEHCHAEYPCATIRAIRIGGDQ